MEIQPFYEDTKFSQNAKFSNNGKIERNLSTSRAGVTSSCKKPLELVFEL